MTQKKFTSDIIHAELPRQDVYRSLSMPLYNTVAFEFDCAEDMEAAFAGKTAAHTYSRISNPTVEYFENRVKAITGAAHVTALNSGMAAIANVFFSIAETGMNIVTSKHLFGNTYSFFKSTLAAFGVDARFCDLTDLETVKQCIDRNTSALFLEIITNPQMEVPDLKAIAEISSVAGIPLIADTTLVPFCAFRATDFGIDIEVVSSTKYISGGATSLGGLIIDYGKFDWRQSRRLCNVAAAEGHNAFHTKLRGETHRNLGACMSPQAAYMQSLGLETLEMRFLKASSSARRMAEALAAHPKVAMVNYPTLPGNRFEALSNKQFGEYPCAMFTIDLASREACFRMINRLKLIRRATNLFDNRSLAIHPASTIFVNFTEEERAAMHVSDRTIRFSVGLEDVDVLLDDCMQALDF